MAWDNLRGTMTQGNTVYITLEEAQREVERAVAEEVDRLRSVLSQTHKLITEGALTGFRPTEGTWADRLFQNQAAIVAALKH